MCKAKLGIFIRSVWINFNVCNLQCLYVTMYMHVLIIFFEIYIFNTIRLARFSTEKILAEELCKITEALEAKDVDEKSLFLKGNVQKFAL